MNWKFAILGLNVLMVINQVHAADFDYRFVHIFSANADEYIVASSNIQKRFEGGNVRYFYPIQNNQEASITYRFNFCAPVTNAYLLAGMYAVNFGSSYGRGSLWGSTNGLSWQQILDMPTPSFDGGATYNTNLPLSILNSTSIWLQARLFTVGWNITAQWLRSDPQPYIFILTADLLKPSVNFRKAVLAHYDNLVIGQQYALESSPDVTNWTSLGSFMATNTSMNHTDFWLLDESTNITTFYRLNGCLPPSSPDSW